MNGKVKLGDFGISRLLDETSTLTRSAGTFAYIAPVRIIDCLHSVK